MKLDHPTLLRLRQSPLLQALSVEQFNTVISRARLHTLQDGCFLFRQGDPLKELYVCTSGCIKLFRLTPNGDEKIIEIIPAGNSFAEGALFMQGGCYPVHAVALKQTDVVGINAKLYIDILHSSNELCIHMLGLVSTRVHWLLNEVERLTLHNATFRLVAFLLEVRDCGFTGNNICFDAPKHVIASRLSIKPETFSRILKRLSERQLIQVHDQYIELIDIEGLEAIVHTEL